MTELELTPDCRRCEALCCVLLPFDEGPAFGFDKPGGVACRHLDTGHRCTIHGQLDARGFSGCVAYDCQGAGQRATELFIRGAAWQGDRARMAEVETGFRLLRQVHEARALLGAAAALPLPPDTEAQRQALVVRLDAGRDWTLDLLAKAVARGNLVDEIRRFLAGLRQHLR